MDRTFPVGHPSKTIAIGLVLLSAFSLIAFQKVQHDKRHASLDLCVESIEKSDLPADHFKRKIHFCEAQAAATYTSDIWRDGELIYRGR